MTMKRIDIPVVVTGPGSQPEEADGAELDYVHMQDDMSTYSMPSLPEPEEVDGADGAIALLEDLQSRLAAHRVDRPAELVELGPLDERSKALLNQVLGDGEVSITFSGAVEARVQESVLAGVWRVQYVDPDGNVERDVVEIGAVPSLVREATFGGARSEPEFDVLEVPDDAQNAASLLTEIIGELSGRVRGADPHVINLSLLPHTDDDIAFLVDHLGVGPTVILSRGYGNCRISSTATRSVWWVQYFNSQDTLILNTIEISDVPEVACAAQEDIDDSAGRLAEILEVYR